jgi:hypothetical protein
MLYHATPEISYSSPMKPIGSGSHVMSYFKEGGGEEAHPGPYVPGAVLDHPDTRDFWVGQAKRLVPGMTRRNGNGDASST